MSVFISGDNTRTTSASRARAQWWSREIELVERLRALRQQVAAVLEDDLTLPYVEWDAAWRSSEVVSALTHACIDRLRTTRSSDTRSAQRLCDLVLNLQQLAMDWYLNQTAMRSERLAGCAAGLNRLRGLPSSAALLEHVCEELVTRCGFHRAVLSKVEARSWKPMVLVDRTDADARSWFSDWFNRTVSLNDTVPEAQAFSARKPSLVQDTSDAPVYRPLIVQAGKSHSYVVAPLVQANEVIGFLHTDHHPQPRRVDEADRDVLWAFADGFSHVYERTILLERLREHRDSVRDLFFGAVDRLDELCEAGAVTTGPSGNSDSLTDASPDVVNLTDRETEVFELMVTGASNQEIADKLVITEGTVKSHVKHILRKYGAVNRAQAIAWALKRQ